MRIGPIGLLVALALADAALAHPPEECECAGAGDEEDEATETPEKADEDEYADAQYLLDWGAQPADSFRYAFAPKDLESVLDGPVRVVVDTGSPAPRCGYAPLRFVARNGTAAPVELSLAYQPSGARGVTVTRSVQLEPGGRPVSVTLPVPVRWAGAGKVEARAKEASGTASPYFSGGGNAGVVLSVGDEAAFERRVKLSPDYDDPLYTVKALLSDELPDELAAYVGFAAVVLADVTLEELPESVRRALEAYAATGGTLVVTRPSRALLEHLPLLESAEPGLHAYGFGRVRLCGDDADECARGIRTEVSLAAEVATPLAGTPQLRRRFPFAGVLFGHGMPSYARTRRPDELLLPQAVAPLGRFLVIIGAFALVIGPGSAYLARKRSAFWLLLTIPFTAGLSAAAIVLYSVLGEGFGTHGSARAVTLLDSARSRAVSVGVAALYANLSQEGARFSSTAALLPSEEMGDVAIDWTSGARFGAGFLPPRTYREWAVVSVHPSRARLSAHESERGLEVHNALGGRIEVAQLRWNGEWYRVRGLEEGAAAVAEKLEADEPLLLARPQYDRRIRGAVLSRVDEQLYRADGSFAAVVRTSSALPIEGLSIEDHGGEAFVFGEVQR